MASYLVVSFSALYVLAISMQPMSAQVVSNLCPGRGLYHHPTDCSAYYECVADRSLPVFKSCGPGTVYNHITHLCDWARNVNCNRNIQPVILTNSIPSSVIGPVVTAPSNLVTVSIANPFGRLNINATACNNIATALSSTLRNRVAISDVRCGRICLDALPNFLVICNQ